MRRTGLIVAGLLGLLLVISTFGYRAAYGNWWQTPSRIPYCGRTYVAAKAGLTLDQVRALESHTALPGDRPYPLVSIGNAPPVVGGQMLAALTPEAQRRKLGVPCTMGLYLKTGDRYTSYVIIGGP